MASFPLQDQPLTLPSGHIVRIYNLMFTTQRDDPSSFLRVEQSFRIQYGTAIPADQVTERLAEAAEVIAYFRGGASAEHSMIVYADTCSTPAQAERKEVPEMSFKFVRIGQGEWHLADNSREIDSSA